MTGLPCTDWSSCGKRAGLEGKTMPVWLGHLRKQTLLGTPLLFLENTPNCPTSMLVANLPDHNVQRLDVCPSDVGWGMLNRRRSFFVAAHKNFVRVKRDWASLYASVCEQFRDIKTEPRHALLATHEEIDEEARHLAELRGKEWTGNWEALLTPRERQSLEGYRRKHAERFNRPVSLNDVWNLGDNSETWPTWSAVSGAIPTYRLGDRPYWYPALGRPMTTMEKVASMGWPVYPELLVDAALPAVTPSREEARFMLGNSWHLPSATVALLTALASTELAFLA